MMLFRRRDDQATRQYNELLHAFNELIDATEAIHPSLSGDEIGWERMSGQSDSLPEIDRKQSVRIARNQERRDGTTKQIIRLYTDFAVGTGLVFTSDDKRIKEVLSTLWNAKLNRRNTSIFGQRRLSKRACTDGELFFALFKQTNPVGIRVINSLEIDEVIVSPEDADRPLFYVRNYVKPGETAYTRQVLLDWNYRQGKDPDYGFDSTLAHVTLAEVTQGSPVVYHALFEGDTRGYPIVFASTDWTRAHRRFMRARIAIQDAIARIATKVKTKGGKAGVLAQRTLLSRRPAEHAGGVGHEGGAYGGTRIESEGASYETVKQETGADAAQVDGAMLLQQAGAASGIFPHYLGAGEAFRLATATAMEPPMMKVFSAYSAQWVEIWRDIFTFILNANGITKTDGLFKLEYPRIYPEEKATEITAAMQLLSGMPFLSGSDTFVRGVLQTAQYGDPDEIMNQIGELDRGNSVNDNVGLQATRAAVELLESIRDTYDVD